MMVTFIAQLYALVGLVSLLGYLPQLMVLVKGEKAPTEISLKTWTIWLFENFVAMLYGIICLQDVIFCVLTGLDLMFVSVLICLVINNRYVKFGPCPSFASAVMQYYFLRPYFGIAEQPVPVKAVIKNDGII